MLAAARWRLDSTSWRFLIGVLFAGGAGLILNSAAAAFSWYLALVLAMAFDCMLGNAYLSAHSRKERATTGALFVGGSLFSIGVFAAMPVLLAMNGGGPGRVLGVLMAASSLVSLMLFAFQAPRFMLLTAAPAMAALLLIPALPVGPEPATALAGALGVGCGVAGFLAHVGHAALTNTKMAAGWRAANQAAKERQREAESKHADAEAARRARAELLAAMTHELRTPLNAVIGCAEIMQEDLSSEGRQELAADAGCIASSAHRLLGLIDQILSLSSLAAGSEALAPHEVEKKMTPPLPWVGGNARSAGGG